MTALAVSVLLAPVVHAQTAKPPVRAELNADLVAAIGDLPIPGLEKIAGQLVRGLQKVTPNGWSSPKMGPFQLHAFLEGSAQAVLLSYDGDLEWPLDLIDETLAEVMGGVKVKDPMVVMSLINGTLTTNQLPASLQKIIKDSYFGVAGLNVRSGMQMIARGGVSGPLATAIAAMGVQSKDFIITVGRKKGLAGVPSEITGSSGRESTGTSAGDEARTIARMARVAKNRSANKAAKAAAKAKGETLPKAPPDYFVEFQTAPGTRIAGPLGMSPITLTDATIFASSFGTMGYKGNATFSSVPNKKFLMFFEAPYDAKGALKIADFKFGLAAPSLDLAEFTLIATSFTSPQAPKGGFLPNLDKYKAPFTALLKPLSAIRVNNPNPVPEYRFGDPKFPFPSIEAFNVALLGPLAKETLGGRVVPGPMLKLVGNTTVLGKQVGSMNVNFSEHGLKGEVAGDFGGLDLSKVGLGSPGFNARAAIDITDSRQDISLNGKVALPGTPRDVLLGFGPTSISLRSPASCALPMEFTGSLPFGASAPTFAQLSGAITGANVDPAKLPQCVGEALKAAYKWIENNGAKLGGYTVVAAKEAGKALEAGGKAVGAAVVQGGQAVADGAQAGARVAAETATNWAQGRWKSHPDRPAYNCTDFNPATNPKFAEAYPPGRLWGSREDYDKRAMNFTRYVWSPAEKKFRPLASEGVLGATACGGLVGEEGVGYGRTNTADKEIWTKAVFCERGQFPQAMVGNPITDTRQCYAARGLQTPARPDLWGKFVHITGSGIDLWFVFTQNGAIRQVARNVNCGAGEQVNMTLHDIYQLPYGGVFSNSAECIASTPAWVKEASARAQAASVEANRVAKCQHISNSYGTWAGRSWGWANADNQNAWSAAGCQTAPTNLPQICRELFRLYGVTAEGWGNIGGEGSESSKLYWAAGCNAMICADAKAKYGVTPASWGSIGSRTAQANIWNQRKCAR
jgi:hypothetical protein